MMAIIFWFEDEIERLQGTKAMLEQNGEHEVRVIRTASEVLPSVGAIKENNAPVLFDLWIPQGQSWPLSTDSQSTGEHGPATGMRVLRELRARLGPDWPIWIDLVI